MTAAAIHVTVMPQCSRFGVRKRAGLFEPFLPPGSLPKGLSAGIGRSPHFVPVDEDPALIRFVLSLPVLK